jgi:hypothetical protein
LGTETRFKGRTIFEDRNRVPARSSDSHPGYDTGVFAKHAALVSSTAEGAVTTRAGFRP